ncbi:MAG TPA: helix-turn-helix transcriptional regulator [Candidatus Dormibacteraeota bacterium]|nr:helix-turn-helix transcriptional regulator [Candidatus Dormibacteraeota bacterium]
MLPPNDAYNPTVARPRTKPRARQGRHLAELRKAAGLSQTELAEVLEVPQSNIAFWEQSDKPPRSDLLPKMAEALGVTVAELLNVNGEMAIAKRSSRPPGKVRKVFEDVSRLPRRQQEKIVEVVSALVSQYGQERQ